MTEPFKKKQGTNPTPKRTNRPVSTHLDRNDKVLTPKEAEHLVETKISGIKNAITNFHTHKVALVENKDDCKCDIDRIVKININNGQLGKIDSNIGDNCRYLSVINGQQSNINSSQNPMIHETENGTTIETVKIAGINRLVKDEKDFWFIKPETFLKNKIKKESVPFFAGIIHSALTNGDIKIVNKNYEIIHKKIEQLINISNKPKPTDDDIVFIGTTLYYLMNNNKLFIACHKNDLEIIGQSVAGQNRSVIIECFNENGEEIIQTFGERLTEVEEKQKKQEGDINKLWGEIKNLQQIINNYKTRIQNLENGLNGRDGRDGENGEIEKLIKRIENLENGKSDPKEIKKAIKEFFIKIFNNEPKNKEDEKLQKDIIGFILSFIGENGGKIVGGDNIKEVINNFIDNLDGEQTKKLAERLKGYLVNINLNNDKQLSELLKEQKNNQGNIYNNCIFNYYNSNTPSSEQPNQEEDNEPGIREQDNYHCNDMPIVLEPASGQSHEVTNTTTTNAKKGCLCPVVKEFVPPCKRWCCCARCAHICNYHQEKLNQLEKEYEAIIRQTMVLIEQLELERQRTGQEDQPYLLKETRGNISWIQKEYERLSNPSNQEVTM